MADTLLRSHRSGRAWAFGCNGDTRPSVWRRVRRGGCQSRIHLCPRSTARAEAMSTGLEATALNETAQLLPNFMLIGAMKTGTTSLYHYLKAHEQVFMPEFKELDFFVAEANWLRGMDWYRRQFSAAGGARARGEASTTYTQYPTHDGVPERIAKVLPGVRLVYDPRSGRADQIALSASGDDRGGEVSTAGGGAAEPHLPRLQQIRDAVGAIPRPLPA